MVGAGLGTLSSSGRSSSGSGDGVIVAVVGIVLIVGRLSFMCDGGTQSAECLERIRLRLQLVGRRRTSQWSSNSRSVGCL